MFKTNSVNWNAVSNIDLIWLEAAFFVDQKIQTKLKQYEIGVSVDIRCLLKDLDDVQRLKLSGGKKDVTLSWDDLPSNRTKMQKKQVIQNNVQIRKAFLKSLSQQFKNKYN